MPLALATAIRRRVVQAHLEGESLKAIAERERLSYSSVRGYWRRYRERGFDGLAPDYDKCGRTSPGRGNVIYRAACFLKHRHQQWGAAFIRVKLEQRYGHEGLPSVRTLQRWFKRAHLTPLKKRIPRPAKAWASAPHEVWQIDAKEQLTLEDGTRACYLTTIDEHSGACLQARAFPPQKHQSSTTARDS